MKNLIIIILLLTILGTSAMATETATLVRVVDGDTLLIVYKGKQEYARLLGIDAPESYANAKAKRDAARTGQDIRDIIKAGKLATETMKKLVKPGDVLILKFGKSRRGKYRRLLVDVYLPDGSCLLKK